MGTSRKYTSRDDAIQREIVEPILAGEVDSIDEYDVEAIASQILGDRAEGYVCRVSPEEFWAIVETNRNSPEKRYARELATIIAGFEFELCDECGKDLSRHVLGPGPLGNAHAFCVDETAESDPEGCTYCQDAPSGECACHNNCGHEMCARQESKDIEEQILSVMRAVMADVQPPRQIVHAMLADLLDAYRGTDGKDLLRRALPMLEQLGNHIGNGPIDPARPDSLGARCDLILDIKRVLGPRRKRNA
jgi:hypothetical protein